MKTPLEMHRKLPVRVVNGIVVKPASIFIQIGVVTLEHQINYVNAGGIKMEFKHTIDLKWKHKYPVITLCGSTRFKPYFEEVNRILTLKGCIVISVGCFGHAGDVFTDEQKEMLDDIHKRKIDMADAIYVINKDGYIGSSTRAEIAYAKEHGKGVYYLEKVEEE